MNKTYQQELIGILGNKPQYFNTTILTKNFFDEPFDIMFEEMRMCYIQEKQINYTRIFENKDIDDDLFISCISNVIHTYEGYFKSLEKQAIEKFKVKMIHEYNKKLLGEDIDVNKFTSLVEDLKKLSIIDTNKLTSKKIKEYTKKKNKLIKFNDYPKMNARSKIKEHDLVIIAGKTGTGKTGYALNLLNDLSKTYPCLYINIELSEDVVVQRLIALNTNIGMDELDNCERMPQQKLNLINKYAESVDRHGNINIITGSKTINEVRYLVGSFDQSKHYIVFIDHIGRIGGYGKGLYEKATNNVIQLRNLCLDFNCTIFALSQLSRESAKAERPSLELIRDSGEVEQSARKVAFVWEDGNNNYTITFCKNDSGSLFAIPVYYNKAIQKFTEI